MKNNAFRRLLAMAAAGAMLTSIAACGSSPSNDTASNGSDSTSLISVNNSEPQNGLTPSDTNEMGGGRVIRYLFEGLVSFDAKQATSLRTGYLDNLQSNGCRTFI